MKLPLKGKRGNGKFALVDRADFPRVNKYSWTINLDGYAMSNIAGLEKQRIVECTCCGTKIKIESIIRRRSVSMHRFILGEPSSEIDHINRNKLDNRKINLRKATRSINCLNKGLQSNNTSGKVGVYLIKTASSKKWRAELQVNGKKHRSGYFLTKSEAVKARDTLFKKYVRF